MYTVAISQLPVKIPILSALSLSIGLGLLNLVGLVPVQMSLPSPRLIILFAAYLLILSGIIYMQLKIIKQNKIGINSSSRYSSENY